MEAVHGHDDQVQSLWQKPRKPELQAVRPLRRDWMRVVHEQRNGQHHHVPTVQEGESEANRLIVGVLPTGADASRQEGVRAPGCTRREDLGGLKRWMRGDLGLHAHLSMATPN